MLWVYRLICFIIQEIFHIKFQICSVNTTSEIIKEFLYWDDWIKSWKACKRWIIICTEQIKALGVMYRKHTLKFFHMPIYTSIYRVSDKQFAKRISYIFSSILTEFKKFRRSWPQTWMVSKTQNGFGRWKCAWWVQIFHIWV